MPSRALGGMGKKLEPEHRFPGRPGPSFKDVIGLIRYWFYVFTSSYHHPSMELLHPLRKTRHHRAADASLAHVAQTQSGR